MDDERLVELLGRAAAVEFAIGSIIKHLPADARKAVQGDMRLFLERSDVAHQSGRNVVDAVRSILKESGEPAA
jgi:hypothetical protein